MSKTDLRARPIFHHTRQSIHAHHAVVTAALAVAHRLEAAIGLSIKGVIRTLKRYRTFTITINGHSLHAVSPIPRNINHLIHTIKPHCAPENLTKMSQVGR